MTKRRSFKQLVRARMEKTGESYTTAARHIREAPVVELYPSATPSPSRPGWHPLVETTAEEARELIDRAIKQEPQLTHYGVGVYDDQRQRWRRGSEQEVAEGQESLRKALLEVAAAADWVKRQKAIKTMNLRHTSYGYKHMVERWFDGRGPHIYVANGAFIAAALGLGFKAQHDSPSDPNVCFNFSARTVKAFA